MVNINIAIDDDLHKQLKLNSIMRQQTLKEFILNCLEEHVSNDPALMRQFPAGKKKGGAK